MELTTGFDGTSEDRMFPSLVIRASVTRHSGFFLINVALPTFFFVPLSHMQFFVSAAEDRLGISLRKFLRVGTPTLCSGHQRLCCKRLRARYLI